jgi:hypothetical protein
MLYCDCNGDDVEIPSLEEHDDGEMVKVSNMADFELLVKAMGWPSVAEFEFDTARYAEDLIGKFWVQLRNVVFVDGEDAPRDFKRELRQSVDAWRHREAEEAKKNK